MFVDFKVCMWERVELPDELQEEVVEFIRKNPDATPDDLDMEFEDCVNYGLIHDYDNYVSLEDNNGKLTIAVLDGEYRHIMGNND